MHSWDVEKDNLIFALDIGTRSVTGVVGRSEEELLRVLHVETVEHTRRAVVDGQIEDIEQTAKIVAEVKARLESQIGGTLTRVHVAAAGRVLRTHKVYFEMDLDEPRPIEPRHVFDLESRAIQQAYEVMLSGEDEDIVFYCVGHSVVRYTLDGYAFSTLLGHRGRRISVELVATFLPEEVVESLYATMRRVDLTVDSLTLEPIAAIGAVIPKELRLLNIALVDVGAGTSDIAVANGGSVSAYTMATVAGDEITEHIMRELLVDFDAAERIKFAVSAGDSEIPYTDILGFGYTVDGEEMLRRIEPAVEHLAGTIAERILDVNGEPPMAIFMVGGGSRTPDLCRRVAAAMGMEENKVAIGGNNYMKRAIAADEVYMSADYATPMGIAITAAEHMQGGGFAVTLNGESVRIQSSGNANVMEVLLRSGYQYGQIIGRSGKNVTFELDGERRVVRGGLPTLANIAVNGQVAGVTTPLSAGDVIDFTPAVSGADAVFRVDQIVDTYKPFSIVIDGEVKPAGTIIRVDNKTVDANHTIQNGEKIQLYELFTIGDILGYTDYGSKHGKLHLNGQADLPLDTPLHAGDQLRFSSEPMTTLPDLPPDITDETEMTTAPHSKAKAGGPERLGAIQVVLNGIPTRLQPKQDGGEHFFFDVLGYTDIDPTNPEGEIVILRNGRGASYIEPIQDGDAIEIFWKTSPYVTGNAAGTTQN